MFLRKVREERDGKNLPALLQNLRVDGVDQLHASREGQYQVVGDTSILRGQKIITVVLLPSRGHRGYAPSALFLAEVVRIEPSVLTWKIIMKILIKGVSVPHHESQGHITDAPLPVGDGNRQAIPTSSHR
jgi:hypothetical protein